MEIGNLNAEIYRSSGSRKLGFGNRKLSDSYNKAYPPAVSNLKCSSKSNNFIMDILFWVKKEVVSQVSVVYGWTRAWQQTAGGRDRREGK